MIQFAVDPTSGHLALFDDALTFAEPIAFRFGLAYREQLDRAGPLGRRWTSALDVLVEREEGTGELIYVNAEGRKVYFFPPKPDSASRNALFKSLFLSAGEGDDLVLEEDGVTYRFSPVSASEWRLAAIVDRNRSAILFERAGALLQRIALPSGSTILFTNDAAGRRTAVRLVGVDGAEALLAAYAYDDGGNLVAATAFSGRTCRFAYDAAGRVAGWNDAERTDVRYDRDEQGRVVGVHTNGPFDGDRYAYDESGTRTLYRPGGDDAAALTYAIDPKIGKIIRVEDCEGVRLEVEYDRHRQKILERNGEGEETRTEWDSEGRLRSTIDAEGRRFIIYHDRHGDVLFTRDPSGAKYRNTFDEMGNRVAAQDPNGFVTEFKHDEAGRVVATMRHDGMMEQRAYDAHGWLCEVLDYRGGRTRFARDGFGRVVAITDPLGHVTRLVYGEGEQVDFWMPSRLVRADGVEVANAWSSDGSRRVLIDGEGRRTTYRLGAFDLVASIENPAGGTVRFRYDRRKYLVEVRNQKDLVWTFARDSAGRVIREVDFDGVGIVYAHDRAYRLIETRYEDGTRAVFTYDRSGLLLAETIREHDTATPKLTRYNYDDRRLLASAKNDDALVLFERDPMGRIVAEVINGRRVKSTYDCCGNRTERRIGDEVVTSLYDPLGGVREIAIGAHVPLRFTRDALGRETRRENGVGFRLDQSYDTIGQLLRQASPRSPDPLSGDQDRDVERSYIWDKASAPTSIVDARWGTTAYTYDANGQVTRARHGDGLEEHFDYDAALNIAGFSDGDGRLQPWLSAPGGRVTEARGSMGERVSLTYDIRRRVIERRVERDGFRPQTWRYGWDGKDRLVRCETPDGEVWRYGYDAFARRLWKAKELTPGEARYYALRHPQLIDISALVVQGNVAAAQKSRLDTNEPSDVGRPPTIGTSFSWDGDVVAEEAPLKLGGATDWDAGTRWYFEPRSFRPLAREDADGPLLHVVTDHLGTPRELMDESGAVAWAAEYRLWGGKNRTWLAANDDLSPSGKQLRSTANIGLRTSSVARRKPLEAAQVCPIHFQGQWQDDETGLYYTSWRYYNPSIGTFVSSDPIGMKGGLLPFSYVATPTILIDPLGLAGFGSGSPPHTATVEVYDANGNLVYPSTTFQSGNMTPAEAELGFPQSTLATHTEARAVDQVPLSPGDTMVIKGQYPPCNSCKGKMNKASRGQNANIQYQWPGEGGSNIWQAK